MKQVIAALALTLSLYGCSAPESNASGNNASGSNASVPSESFSKKALAALITRGMDGAPFTIDSFEKTNGMKMEGLGMDGYAVMYRATVSYPQGVRPQCITHAAPCPFGPQRWPDPHLPGTTENLDDTLHFMKTERGWQLAD